ncbi:MAG: hypothetical protein V4666_08120 [Bacteroidota bacterium]
MDPKKIISFRHVSEVLTGNKQTIRADRPNTTHSKAVNEMLDFVSEWIKRNSKSDKAEITIKTKS